MFGKFPESFGDPSLVRKNMSTKQRSLLVTRQVRFQPSSLGEIRALLVMKSDIGEHKERFALPVGLRMSWKILNRRERMKKSPGLLCDIFN